MTIDYRDGIGKVGSKPEDAHRSYKIFSASIVYLISRNRKVFKHSTIIYFLFNFSSPCLSTLDELAVLHLSCLFLFLHVYHPSYPLYSIALP